jgi:hypothetical protein
MGGASPNLASQEYVINEQLRESSSMMPNSSGLQQQSSFNKESIMNQSKLQSSLQRQKMQM